MLKRNPVKLLLLALAAIPFAVKVMYLERAWVSSPIDRIHLGLYGTLSLIFVFIAVVAKLYWRFLTVKPLAQSRSLKLMALPCILYVIGIVWSMNAVQLISSVLILWTAAWALYGRVSGIMLAPAAVCAVLAVPGSLYWLGNAYAAFAATPNAAYTPEFTVDSQVGMLGREEPANSLLFRTSKARQFRYENISNSVMVLSVEIGNDVHEVHPATHCLRSQGWRIVSEHIVTIPDVRDEKFSVTEAEVDSVSGKLLVWIWYSNNERSTGSFLHFRRLFSSSSRWHTYQISTAIGPDGKDAAKRRLASFLRNK